MADYLVLEEDGTSRLELEESTDDLVLEESAPFALDADPGEYTVAGAGATLGTVTPVQPATWKVGTITVPSSTGAMSVTGLGGEPKAVFFYGTNWLTEDTAVTTTGTGVFRGMCAPKYDDAGTLLQGSATVTPAGDQHRASGAAIMMQSTTGSAATLYAANVSSLDTDGFSLDWITAASGGYKVIYVALMDTAECGAFVGAINTTLTLGWKAGASLLHGAWGGPVITGSDRTQEFYGGGAYPGSGTIGWYSAGLTAFTFPTSASQQRNIGIYNLKPNISVTQGGHFVSQFLVTANIRAFPTGADLTSFRFDGDANDGGMIVIWDDEDSLTGRLTPATTQGGTVTQSGLPFAPGLLLGYSIGDEPQGQGQGVRGAAGFSVITPEFQWTALVDGSSSRGAFQSFQRGVVDSVNGTSVHAATVALTNDGFVVTTEEDDIAAQSWVWHAFGHPERFAVWIPQMYRRLAA